VDDGTSQRRPAELGLGAYFLFPFCMRPSPRAPAEISDRRAHLVGQLFPPLALLLVLGSMLNSSLVSFAIWPVILLIDVLAIVLAWVSASFLVFSNPRRRRAVLILTLSAACAWLFKIPTDVRRCRRCCS